MAPPISADMVVEALPEAPEVVSASMITVVSKQTVLPEGASPVGDLELSVSDMLMMSCSYIKKGLFFQPPTGTPIVPSLVSSLSRALGVFPPLAGRLVTLPDGRIVIRYDGDDSAVGVEFYHAVAPALSLADFLVPDADVPTMLTKDLFPMDRAVGYEGHHRPLASFQVTVLGDGAFFVGVAANHAVVDGTSFWHFFSTWAGLCRGEPVLQPPDFSRNFFGSSTAVLRFPSPAAAVNVRKAAAPLRERVVHFSAAAIRALKAAANGCRKTNKDYSEVNGNVAHDDLKVGRGEISSFQSMCAHMWLAVTRARPQLAADATTKFIMAVNCRQRLRPKISPVYFGNAIQIVEATATVAELAANGLRWAAGRLHATVVAHDDGAIRQAAAEWEAAPWCFPRGDLLDGAALILGSSPRFPMYDGTDFGWGRAVAVRSGCDGKIDGVLSALPGQAGDGSVDFEVCLAPDTMARLLGDNDFLQYVSHAP